MDQASNDNFKPDINRLGHSTNQVNSLSAQPLPEGTDLKPPRHAKQTHQNRVPSSSRFASLLPTPSTNPNARTPAGRAASPPRTPPARALVLLPSRCVAAFKWIREAGPRSSTFCVSPGSRPPSPSQPPRCRSPGPPAAVSSTACSAPSRPAARQSGPRHRPRPRR